MKCQNLTNDMVDLIPMGYKLVGRRFKDITLSVHEIQQAVRDTDDPEQVWKYIQSLFYTLRPTE